MKKIIPCVLLVCLIVAVVYPTLSGVELGNKIIGKDSWLANQINTIKPLADAANFVSQTIQKIVVAVGEVIDAVINFFKNPWGSIFQKKE